MGKVEWKRQHRKKDMEWEIKRWEEKDKTRRRRRRERLGGEGALWLLSALSSFAYAFFCYLKCKCGSLRIQARAWSAHCMLHMCGGVCWDSPWPGVICHHPLFPLSRGVELEEVPLTALVWHLSVWWMEAGMDWWMRGPIHCHKRKKNTLPAGGHAPFN